MGITFEDKLLPFPPLSHDIARLIVERAAESDKITSSRLALVSKEVSKWSDPFLFRHLSLEDFGLRYTLTPVMLSRDVQKHVKSVSYDATFTYDSEDDVQQILELFPNLSSFAIFTPYLGFFPEVLENAFPALRHVFLSRVTGAMDFSAPVVRSVTHLDVTSLNFYDWSKSWESTLLRMPNLTHLALDGNDFTEQKENMLTAVESLQREAPPMLQVLILIMRHVPNWSQDISLFTELCAGTLDERIVVAAQDVVDGKPTNINSHDGAMVLSEDYIEVWNEKVNYDQSYWGRAMQIVEERKKGKQVLTT